VKLPDGEEEMRDPWTNRSVIDHRKLTNEELYKIVCTRIPHMVFLDVTDEIRETVIAMIEVSDLKA
jgi:hypothetical protein